MSLCLKPGFTASVLSFISMPGGSASWMMRTFAAAGFAASDFFTTASSSAAGW